MAQIGAKRGRGSDATVGAVTVDNIDPADQEVKAKLDAFRVAVSDKAIVCLRDILPNKILYFNKLVDVSAAPGSVLHSKDLKPSEVLCKRDGTDLGTKKVDDCGRECYTHHVPTHEQVMKELEDIKRETSELIEVVGDIKLWIQLNVPRIEDGNNFGVGIQEVAIQQLARAEDSAFGFSDAIVKYHIERAKLATKVIKYPNVMDYQQAISQLDEKEWLHIKITHVDIRNTYSMLYDLLAKNWEKVVKPKNEDTHHRMTF